MAIPKEKLMTTEEAKNLRKEAENVIVEILNELEERTKCKVSNVDVKTMEEERYNGELTIRVNRQVNISLEV